jgi:hypothetical protein
MIRYHNIVGFVVDVINDGWSWCVDIDINYVGIIFTVRVFWVVMMLLVLIAVLVLVVITEMGEGKEWGPDTDGWLQLPGPSAMLSLWQEPSECWM